MQKTIRTASISVLLLTSLTIYACFIGISTVHKRQERAVSRTTQKRPNYLAEADALRDKPITDIREATYLKYSTARLIGGRSAFNVGERIFIAVVLKNGFRMRKRKGGDRLEVRIVNDQLKASAAGHVIDYDDGTYTAVVDALWPGKHNITVTLTFRRELIRAVYVAQSEHKDSSGIHGKFVTDSAEEETICHPKAVGLSRYNYTEICNLTTDNGGMSWYCGKPADQKLLCEDWASIRGIRQGLAISDTELDLLRFGPQPCKNISITVKGQRMARTSLPSCTKIPAQYTWMKGGLTGYYYNNKWFPRYCNKPERLNLQKCLKNQRLILFGDSTVRYWYKYLMDHLTCMSVTEHWAKEKWHKRSSCVIKRLNFTMEWKPHAQPFNVGSQWDTKRYTTHSIANHIEGLASSADVIIVIHMFSHLNNYHMSVFRDRMRVISKSVKRFLMRNRNAKVFIKGPHTHKLIGSMFSHVYRDIIREEFNESLDDVYYLDQAAMTLAKGNVDVHPATDIVREAVKQMLGFICV